MRVNSLKESLIFHSVNVLGKIVRVLPLGSALCLGRAIGIMAYYCDFKHKILAYANLRRAFAHEKTPREIKRITKNLFKNYGQNFIDLFRMPLITPERFKELIEVEGEGHLAGCLKEGKGAIMLAMHFGSWELASLSCALIGLPYKVIVRPQSKYSRLDELLNSYRSCGGYVVLSRGLGTRDFVRGLQNNEVIGMVVDQGGKDGMLVPFFGRRASMSVGAVRMGLKWGVPLCFSVIHRKGNGGHRMIVHKPLELIRTGASDQDIASNLSRITKVMEDYIREYPSEYMWFYKIWKYSDETSIAILSDGKTGHLRQSQAAAKMLEEALSERNIRATVQTVPVVFKSGLARGFFSLLNFLWHPFFLHGRLSILEYFLTKDSFDQAVKIKADFIISCGSAVASINNFLAREDNAKSIVILNPGILNCRRFDLAILPRHEALPGRMAAGKVVVTLAAPNLITKKYQQEQSHLLLQRYSHLKDSLKVKIGLFIGGDSRHVFLSEQQIKTLVHQVTEVAREINADILATTSRRTPPYLEQLLQKMLKRHPSCRLLIAASQDDVPEAVGGILGLSDIQVVSGDSISMISEAASSGKNTIVFSPECRKKTPRGNKHQKFIDGLNAQGYVLSTPVKDIGHAVYDVAKNKIRTRRLDDHAVILDAMRRVI
jgi:KDO2-lipid IV(A) lauroyltransferase